MKKITAIYYTFEEFNNLLKRCFFAEEPLSFELEVVDTYFWRIVSIHKCIGGKTARASTPAGGCPFQLYNISGLLFAVLSHDACQGVGDIKLLQIGNLFV